MALQTTVRPKDRVEYDLDLVMQLDKWTGTIADYHATLQRELQKYASQATTQDVKVAGKSRCVRLEYSKSFHLDVVPARFELDGSRTAINVPDRDLTRWLLNNPIKYQAWFEAKCRVNKVVMAEAREQAPLPPNSSAKEKAPLKSAVQLLKRRRDRWYAEQKREPEAPPSIVVTTFAASHYDGVDNVADSVATLVQKLAGFGEYSKPKLMNPAVDGEDFLAAWSSLRLEVLRRFATRFVWEMNELMKGGPNAQKLLEEMFGEPVRAAFQKLAEDTKRQAEGGGLRVGATGLLGTVGTTVKPHTFFGK